MLIIAGDQGTAQPNADDQKEDREFLQALQILGKNIAEDDKDIRQNEKDTA